MAINKRKQKSYLLRVKPADPKTYCEFITVEAWDKSGSYMMDEHIVDEVFPELEELMLLDLAEGVMEYGGTLSVLELTDALREIGFEVQIAL